LLEGETLLPEPQQARSRRTREAVLQAALRSFEARGYEAATVDEIARLAEIAVGGFYLHFRSKRQALLVLMDRLIGELATLGASQGVALGTRSARTAVEMLVRVALRVDMKYFGALRAWQEAILRDDELARLQTQIEAWTTARVIAMLGALAKAPNFRRDVDPATLARVLNALFWRLTEMRAGADEAVIRSTIGVVTHSVLSD
jgi:AcrR family transcriptional regulator